MLPHASLHRANNRKAHVADTLRNGSASRFSLHSPSISPGDLVIAMLARSFPAATHRVIVRQTCRVCQYRIWCCSRTHDSLAASGVAHAHMTRLYLVSSVDCGICSRVQDARHRAHQFGRFSNTTGILSICRHVSQRLANAKPVVVCHVWLRKQARELFVSEGHGARCFRMMQGLVGTRQPFARPNAAAPRQHGSRGIGCAQTLLKCHTAAPGPLPSPSSCLLKSRLLASLLLSLYGHHWSSLCLPFY